MPLWMLKKLYWKRNDYDRSYEANRRGKREREGERRWMKN